jgi:hypothetical protein
MHAVKGFNSPGGMHADKGPVVDTCLRYFRTAKNRERLPPEEATLRATKMAEGLRLCYRCGEYRMRVSFAGARCGQCSQQSDANSKAIHARYAEEAKARALKEEQESLWVIDVVLAKKVTRYGTFKSYMDVYNFLERVYPDVDDVPQNFEICQVEQTKGAILPIEELEMRVRRGDPLVARRRTRSQQALCGKGLQPVCSQSK